MKTVEELNYRRIFKWGDFLEEIKPKVEQAKLNREDKKYLKVLIDRGEEIQTQLNEPCLGYMSLSEYYKQMNLYSNLQDIVIDEIIFYIEESIKYIKEKDEKHNKNNK